MTNLNPTVLTDVQTCPAVAYQSASVCVPVTVTPYAKPGTVLTKCCGDPVVVPGKNTCEGVKKGSCIFTVTQELCIAVPVEFWATADTGDTYVSCNGATSEDVCTDCGQSDDSGDAVFGI